MVRAPEGSATKEVMTNLSRSGTTRRTVLPLAVLVALLLSSLAAALVAGTAIAFRGPQSSATLTLQAPAQSVVGQNVGVVAVLGGRQGQSAGHPITLFVDNVQLATKFSDWQGRATFTIPGSRLNAVKVYRLTAVADGGRGRRSSAVASLNVIAGPTIGPPSQGSGSGTSAQRTSLSLAIPTGSPLGNDVAVTASLKDAAGHPMPGQHLALTLDGVQLKSDDSDPTGHVAFSIPGKKLNQAGGYAVQATFSGSHGYSASAANATLTIVAAAIQIRTVPAVAGLGFSLGGVTATTGPDGVAALPVPESGIYKLTSDLNPDATGAPTVRAGFVRWADEVYTASRTIVVDGPATYVMGLRVAYSASVRYLDMSGRPVDPAVVDEAHFRADDGTDVALNTQTGTTKVWWTANTTAAVQSNGVTAAPIKYRAVSVKIHGLEALAPDQQEWTPSDGDWTIRLQIYDLSVRVQDVVFGGPASGQVRLSWPDRTSVAEPVGADGRVTFSGLPAGNYLVSVAGVTTRVSLPGSHVATLRVLSSTDVALEIAAGLAIGLLMLLTFVRWRSLRRRRV
jgi:hypothetical protein